MGHFADGFAGGRVDHVQRLAAGGIAPFVVDEELGVFVSLGRHSGLRGW